jgi:magnesium-transporting ATPase (P-type)
VLPTRLSVIDEAATTDDLGADKTGTLARNDLTVASTRPLPGFHQAANDDHDQPGTAETCGRPPKASHPDCR